MPPFDDIFLGGKNISSNGEVEADQQKLIGVCILNLSSFRWEEAQEEEDVVYM